MLGRKENCESKKAREEGKIYIHSWSGKHLVRPQALFCRPPEPFFKKQNSTSQVQEGRKIVKARRGKRDENANQGNIEPAVQ